MRFGDITLKLDNADPKRNRYSVEIRADDKKVPKKDKSLNEPVQFYTSKGGHTPYEAGNQLDQQERDCGLPGHSQGHGQPVEIP